MTRLIYAEGTKSGDKVSHLPTDTLNHINACDSSNQLTNTLSTHLPYLFHLAVNMTGIFPMSCSQDIDFELF